MVNKEAVIKKADEYLDYAINHKAKHLPREIQEDIKQIGFERVLRQFEKIDFNDAWKAFVQQHCNGAVLDYLKSPKNQRYYQEIDEQKCEVDSFDLLNIGLFYNSFDDLKLDIKWDLVARLASKDDRVLLVARFVLGHTLSDISRSSNFSRERINQKFKEFCELLDDPFEVENKWVNQIIYAFGLSEHFHMEAIDNGEGWDLEPIDIFKTEINLEKNVYTPQMELI